MARTAFSITRHISRGLFAAAVVTASACSDNPAAAIEGAGDPENISRVTVTLTSTAGATTTSQIVDPDGTQLPKSPNAPVGTLTLAKGATYNGTISLLNDLDTQNVVDISAEVRKEANFHRFFYTVTCAGITIPDSALDLDTQSPAQPLGLKFSLTVAATATSTTSCMLHVELHHFETNKGTGLGSNFETDLSTNFPITIS